MDFQIRVADRNIKIQSLYNYVYKMCSDYLVSVPDSDCDFSIVVSQDDIEYERSMSSDQVCESSGNYLETLAVYRKIAEAMIGYDTLLFHGSVVGFGSDACMISAPSGTGKTTFSDLWLKNIRDTYIINGDKPLVSVSEDGLRVYGTPWSGKECMNQNVSASLKHICFLKRSDANEIRKIDAFEAFPSLLSQVYRSKDASLMRKTVKLLSVLIKNVQFYQMTLKYYPTKEEMERQAAYMAFDYMSACR